MRIQQLIEQKKILINGKSPKPSMKLRGGEEIVITGEVELPPLKAFAEDIPLDVVYEDESIAVVNKPAGMSVHAGSGKGEAGNRGTMVNALLHRFNQLSGIGGELRPGIVHRLDKETSGLVLVAKSDLAHRKLAEQFSRREVKKTYIALMHGWPKMTKGTINAAISRDMVRRARMTTRRASQSRPGREAVTHWQVTEKIEGRLWQVCPAGGEDRNGPDAPDPGTSLVDWPPGGGRYFIWRAAAPELRRYSARGCISEKELSACFRDTIPASNQ